VLAFVTAFTASLSKLAVDATIQEKIKENVRASAFAHSETVLMLAWVLGGTIGLIPFPGRIGIILCALAMAAATARAGLLAYRLRHDNLSGVYADTAGATAPTTTQPATTQPAPSPPATTQATPSPTATTQAATAADYASTEAPTVEVPRPGIPEPTLTMPFTAAQPTGPGSTQRWSNSAGTTQRPTDAQRSADTHRSADTQRSTERHSTRPKTRWARRIFERPAAQRSQMATEVLPRGEADEPTYHLYRPSTLHDEDDRSE
jgi:hypothetical protein